jgi:ribonuclease-3
MHVKKEKFKAAEIQQVETALGYVFKDASILDECFAHASAVADGLSETNNERLEFLGDRVLGLIIAEFLNKEFDQAPEGELAKRLNGLVRKETCTKVAQDLGLVRFIRVGRSEKKGPNGVDVNPAIVGDLCEAVIAAIYLDGGLDAVRDFIHRGWGAMMAGDVDTPKDPKTALQEWSQSLARGTPMYELKKRSGPDHAPEFEIEVTVAKQGSGIGLGGSRKIAERNAATDMLVKKGIWSDDL